MPRGKGRGVGGVGTEGMEEGGGKEEEQRGRQEEGGVGGGRDRRAERGRGERGNCKEYTAVISDSMWLP